MEVFLVSLRDNLKNKTMIKKLLSIASFCAIFSVANAQTNLVAEPAGPLNRQAVVEAPSSNINNAKASVITTGDTLWYFYNKAFYRNVAAAPIFYTVPSPNTFLVSHFGSRFMNTNPNLAITGLEAVASRSATSPSSSVTVRMYLCNVTAGLPVFPALDSVSAVVTGTAGTFVGGDFATPKFVAGDYAVLIKGVPTVVGDVAKVWMNNAHIATATATTAITGSKYGEAFGYIRATTASSVPATFFVNTGQWINADTDFEYLVAPRVGFTASAGQNSPPSTLCTGTSYLFSNTTNFPINNRQYNLNEMYRYWRPFSNTVTIMPAPDSVYTWTYGDATGNFYANPVNPNNNHTYAAAGTFNGSLIAKYRKMTDNGVTLADAANFSKIVSTCAGITTFSGIEAVNVYPNPSSGLVYIANLPSESTIEVMNMLGQSVYSSKANAGNFTADLSGLSNGSYFVKINSLNEKTKIVKLILN